MKILLSANQVIHKSRNRIAFVTGCLKLGGSTTFLINLCGELLRRGWIVEVISLEADNPLIEDFSAQRIPVTCFDEKKYIFEDRVKAALVRLGMLRANYVVATLGPPAFEILRYLPKHVVAVGMGQSDDPQVYSLLELYRSFFRTSVVVSQRMANKLADMGGTYCIPYGVPIPKTPLNRKQGKSLRILYLGRLERPQKRVELFPIILHQLRKSGISFHWTVAGDGPEMDWLKLSMPSQEGKKVSFLGKIDYRDVPALLERQDIYLLASEFEGLPLSLLEGMGSGLVPVVSNLPSGIPEVVTQATGYLVDPNRPEAYADAIIKLARNPQELLRKSVAARQIIERNFSIETMANHWTELLFRFEPRDGLWPSKYSVKPPLTDDRPLYYSRAVRCVRRVLRRCF